VRSALVLLLPLLDFTGPSLLGNVGLKARDRNREPGHVISLQLIGSRQRSADLAANYLSKASGNTPL